MIDAAVDRDVERSSTDQVPEFTDGTLLQCLAERDTTKLRLSFKALGGFHQKFINLLLSCLQWVMCFFVSRDEL